MISLGIRTLRHVATHGGFRDRVVPVVNQK